MYFKTELFQVEDLHLERLTVGARLFATTIETVAEVAVPPWLPVATAAIS